MTGNVNRFSSRLGLRQQQHGPLIYHEAPESLRVRVLNHLHDEMQKSPPWIRQQICVARGIRPDPSNWSEYPNIWDEAQHLVYSADWYEFYDFIEACARCESQTHQLDQFESALNRLLDEERIGWRLHDGALEAHGDDDLEAILGTTEDDLSQSGYDVAAREFREARADISRRPDPDLSGAIHHAWAALESVAREVSGDRRKTLGDIIKTHPGLLPPPVDEAAAKLWGFASNEARHGNEARSLDWAETLLVVGVAGVLCSYLNAKYTGSRTSRLARNLPPQC